MKRQVFLRSLPSKLFTSYLLLIIIPVSLIAYFSFDYSQKIISAQISKSNSNVLVQIEKNIEQLVDQITAIINIYNIDTELGAIIREEYPKPDSYEALKAKMEVERKMLNYSFPFDWLSLTSILIGSNGIVYNPYDQITINAENITDFHWYHEASQNKDQIYWIDSHKTFKDTPGNQSLFTAVKFLQDKYTNKVSGILLLSIPEKNLYSIFQSALNQNNQIFIVNDEGLIISHSDREQVGKQLDAPYKYLISSDTTTNVLRDGENIIVQKTIARMGWHVVEVIPTASVFADIQSLRLKMLFTALLGIVFSVVFALWFSKKLSMPILQLSKRVQNHLTENKTETKNEIDILTSGYDEMIFKLEKTVSKLVNYQEDKRRAELKALQMQINPHFIYNTLSSIKCLVWVNKTELIEPTINAMVNLLESTIDRFDEFITVEEELDIIRNYVYIHQIRTDHSIAVEYHLDSQIKNAKVPKLILQPIIENAIFHGIEPAEWDGVISIRCSTVDQEMSIEIKDNGVGFDESHQIAEGTKLQFTGVGLNNVDERLKLYFGKHYGITLHSESGNGTLVRLKLPLLV